MTQKDLALLLNFEQQAISNYERDIREPSLDEVRKFCEIFEVTADYFLGISIQRTAQISEDDAALLDAYHAASPEAREMVDFALARYMEKKGSSASLEGHGGENGTL